MAINTPASYGRDIAAVFDADDLFSDIVGTQVLEQDAIHTITSDSFLGPGGDTRGFDMRLLIGAKQKDLDAQQPVIAAALEDDDRISRADIVLTEIRTNGLIDARLDATVFTTDGRIFQFTKLVSELTTTTAIEGEQAS